MDTSFDPRPVKEATAACRVVLMTSDEFRSTPPWRRRRAEPSRLLPRSAVSIHAPVTEATDERTRATPSTRRFDPRLRYGADCLTTPPLSTRSSFDPPPREACG